MKFTPIRHQKAFVRSATLLAVVVLVAGCSVAPQALDKEEVTSRVKEDTEHMFSNQVPFSGPVSLEEALARSLKYNLDYRLKRMESALALGLTRYASKDMLPQLLLSAGYQERSNYSGGTSMGILDGVETTKPVTSNELASSRHGINFSWNALDFGVSYYRAKQQGNEFLIAEERRRKVVHNLLQDTRAAYWRAVGAQRLNAQADEVMARANQALSRSREAESQRAISPGLALAYQRALLDATSLLNQRRQELQYAKQELAALMSAPAGANFVLADVAEPALPAPPRDMVKLEELALLQRPELREEDLRKRITADEARKQLVGLLPGITLNLGLQGDSNRFQYHNSWSEGGLNVAWNLMRLVALPSMKEAQDFQVKTDQARRVALSMAIITQTRLGAERYRMALEDFKLANEAAQVDKRLAEFTRASVSAKLESELEAVRTQARALLGDYQRANAYANAHIAYGRLYNALGFDPIADDFEANELDPLIARMKDYIKASEQDAFALSSQLFSQFSTLSINVSGAQDLAQKVRLTALAKDILGRHDIEVVSEGKSALGISMTQVSVGAGLHRMEWTLTLNNEDKTPPKTLTFNAIVHADARRSVQETALSSALSTHIFDIKKWMGS